MLRGIVLRSLVFQFDWLKWRRPSRNSMAFCWGAFNVLKVHLLINLKHHRSFAVATRDDTGHWIVAFKGQMNDIGRHTSSGHRLRVTLLQVNSDLEAVPFWVDDLFLFNSLYSSCILILPETSTSVRSQFQLAPWIEYRQWTRYDVSRSTVDMRCSRLK